MYKSEDGLRHQSNMLVKINEADMKITYCRSGVYNIYWNGYVSHSFNQFILTDGNYIYTIDHGDGYPRAISICKTAPNAETPTSVACAYAILGNPKSTATGVSIGGAELSTNNCLIVGNSLPQKDTLNFQATRNIFLTVTKKDNPSKTTTTLKWLTNYSETSGITTNTPQLVKINDNKFLVMWEESTNYGKIKMILIDGNGNSLSDIINVGGRLSDCQPVIYNNKVTWYTTLKNGTPIFFTIDVSTIQKFNEYNNKNIIDYSKFLHYTYYKSFTGEISLTKYDDKLENATIPSIDFPWAKVVLSEGLFKDCTNVKTVTISNGIDTIPRDTFYDCTNLTKVNIPLSVTTIGEQAFLGSGITQITIPNSVTTVGAYAFRNCKNLTTVTLSNKLTELPKYMFYNCEKLQNIAIPSSVITIGDAVFSDTGITHVNIPSSVKTIGNYVFYNCENLTGTVTIPSTVTSIGDSVCSYSYGVDKLVIKNPNATMGTRLLIHSKTIEKGQTYRAIEGAKITSSISGNKKIATVTADGLIKAVGEGYVSISYYNKAGEMIGATNLTVTKPSIPFTDVSTDSWYYSAVKYCYDNKIILGTTNTTFEPNTKLTRGMLVTILHRMEGQPYVAGTSKFPDVQDTKSYYYVAIKWATQNKIVSGYSNGKFGPNDPITREQLAVILNQYCRYKGKYKAQSGSLSRFKDGNKVSEFAKWGMQWATGAGVITGSDGYINPQGKATRAEVASMLYKYCLNIK